MMRKLMLDLDLGVDDAMALAFALASPEVELVGVTATFGNVPTEVSARNCQDLLALLGAADVPVAVGADRPLAAEEPWERFAGVHGPNGIGGVALPPVPDRARRAARGGNAAADALIAAAEAYGEDLIYVPTGPLTNLACAWQRDPEAVARIGTITFMGGALTVPGNVTPAAEANIAADPEAADIVLRSGLALTMVGLDVTHRVMIGRDETARWRALGTPAGAALADIVDYYIGASTEGVTAQARCCLHDPLAVAAAIDPCLVATLATNLKVDLTGALRGRTIGDEARTFAEPTVEVAVDVDGPAFLERFTTRMRAVLAR